ncbi:MAG: bifunctional demethylmenaquinone methyltransferase/2-methoxy-6-polyprenyl-1,4-benzoquinol methylase UbiE [Coriobacteriales bacterium]|nr:bifunctional demethylmenaquinone methyltransferase/2-methoxy-6-polyprenyl-1,4-benzoquinol methylase UbiE [Coriobacteriales bacterium]
MSSFDKSKYVHGVFSRISDKYDVMNDLGSLGFHRIWKAKMVKELAKAQPKRILDIACGTGDIAIALAKALPAAEVIGLDFNGAMLQVANSRAAAELGHGFIIEGSDDTLAKSTNKLHFVVGNAMELPFANESFDAACISFGLRNMPDYAQVLKEIFRVLKPKGKLYCLEASYPTHKLVRSPFKLYFKHWLPTLAKLVVNSPEEYAWLNTSTEAFLSKDELAFLMESTGFASVSYKSFLSGAAALHHGTKG